MDEAAREILGGVDRVRAIVNKQRRIKDGRPEKKKASNVGKSHGLRIKKSVNGYIIFRTAMQHVFSDYTQGERSPFVREMWEKEIHKPTWILVAKVWTHIRDYSGGFNNTLQYAVAAIEETRLTQPDRWLSTYNMVLVRDGFGAITLRQHTPPTSIPDPRQLTDVELLFRVLKRGLPVKNPVELLDSLVRSQRHYMTVSDPALPLGKANTNFVNMIDIDPLTALSHVVGLAPTHITFDRGVGDLDTLGTVHIDDGLLVNPGIDRYGGFQFDDSTAHLTLLNNGALDASTMLNGFQTFEMGVPTQWDRFSGQISQNAYQIATNTVQNAPDPYPFNKDFLDQFPGWDLQ